MTTALSSKRADITRGQTRSSQRNRISLFAARQRLRARKRSSCECRIPSCRGRASGPRAHPHPAQSGSCKAYTRPSGSPDATRGCGGRFARPKIASISSRETLAKGLNFRRAPSSSTTGMAARKPPWNRLRPLIQPANGFSARESGSTFRIRQQASGSENQQLALGILARQRLFRRLDRAHVAKTELPDQRIAIGAASPRTASRCRGRSREWRHRHPPSP